MTIDRRHAGRVAVLGLLVIGIVAAWRWRHLFDPLALTELIGRNPWAPLAFLALHAAASLFFVPRTLLALGAGMVFGMWWGVVWAALGSVGGAVAGFLVARMPDLAISNLTGVPAWQGGPGRRASRRWRRASSAAAGAWWRWCGWCRSSRTA